MNLKKIMMSKDGIDEHTFGKFIRECREAKGLTVRAFAKELGCSPAYLSDIEKGNRYAPKNYLDKLFIGLGIPEEDRQSFHDLAAATRGFLSDDINSYVIEQQPLARVALRKAMEVDLSDEQWMTFINLMDENE